MKEERKRKMKQLKNTRLRLGRTVMTRAARAALSDKETHAALSRHESCDWGDVCEEDWRANNRAVLGGERVLSAYAGADGKFWIITEADRSVTTILLPADY
jgi:hypothetical protein